MKLYGYFRSSTSFRTRIALNLKGLDYDQAALHLRKGEQRGADYLRSTPRAWCLRWRSRGLRGGR